MKSFVLLCASIFSVLSSYGQYKFQSAYNYTGAGPQNSANLNGITPDWRGGFYTISELMGSATQGGGLVRYAPDGTIIDSRFISGTDVSRISQIQVAPSNQLYLAGSGIGGSGYSQPMVMKTDSLGNVIWAKVFELSSFQGQYDATSSMVASDGGIIVLFSRSDVNVPVGNTNAFSHLIKVSSTGNLQWSKQFSHSTINNSPLFLSDLGGNQVMVGMQGNDINTGDYYSHIALINQSGTLLDQAMVLFDPFNVSTSLPNINFMGVTKKANGNYMLGGNTWNTIEGKGFMAELNSTLDVISCQGFINSSNENINPIYMKENANGSWTILGITFNAGLGGGDAYYAELNSSLQVVYANAFGDSRHNNFTNSGATSDGGFYLAGTTMDSGNPNENESHVCKIDPNGQAGCNEGPFTINQSAFTFTLSTGSYSFNSVSLTSSNLSPVANAITINDFSYCSSQFCDIQVGFTQNNVSCNGGTTGSINLTVSNAQAPIAFAWTGPSGFSSPNEDITSLGAGTYNVTITDNAGCTATGTYIISEPAAIQSSAVANGPACSGDNNGSINLTVTGGTTPYNFLWNGPSTFNSSLEDINGLIAGTYNIFITDDNGCSASNSFVLASPSVLTVNISASEPSCFGLSDGSLTANVTGGTAPFDYQWNNGAVTATVNSLSTGNYSVTVTDDNGCSTTANSSLNQPAPLAVNITIQDDPTCQNNDGSLIANVSGGTSPYNFAWSSGGNSSTENNLAAGSYSVSVTDDNGCSANGSITLVNVVPPIEICVVSVDTSSQYNEIIWEKPVVDYLSGFNIYRLVGASYQLVDFWPYDSLSQYTDSTPGINPNTTSYLYKISAVDSCGNESVLSSEHETMHLTVSPGVGGEMNLVWDNYQGIAFPYYRIGRFVNGSPTWNLIDSVTSANTTYTDINPPAGSSVRYIIQIVLPGTCTSTRAINHNSTRSNRSASIMVGVKEEDQTGWTIYPNPSNGMVKIEMDIPNEAASVKVTNQLGSVVFTSSMNSSSQTIDLSSLSNGVYYLTLSTGEHSSTRKIIIQK